MPGVRKIERLQKRVRAARFRTSFVSKPGECVCAVIARSSFLGGFGQEAQSSEIAVLHSLNIICLRAFKRVEDSNKCSILVLCVKIVNNLECKKNSFVPPPRSLRLVTAPHFFQVENRDIENAFWMPHFGISKAGALEVSSVKALTSRLLAYFRGL